MMCVTGVCSDEKVCVNNSYLARIGERYFVVKLERNPQTSIERTMVPFKQAVYVELHNYNNVRTVYHWDELTLQKKLNKMRQ